MVEEKCSKMSTWIFALLAKGLSVSDDRTCVFKAHTVAVDTKVSDTFVVGQQAFSAQAAKASRTEAQHAEEVCTFTLEADCDNALVGWSPPGADLATPLSWETPSSFFVELSATGSRLWSDELGVFGVPLNKTACNMRGTTVRLSKGHADGEDNRCIFVAINGSDATNVFTLPADTPELVPTCTLFGMGSSLSIS
jgi:hypothetical protein